MQLYDPTAAAGPERHLERAPPLGQIEGKTIAVIENAKLNAPEMLGAIADIFAERHGCTVLPYWTKPNASAPADAAMLAEAVAKADFLITGLGD